MSENTTSERQRNRRPFWESALQAPKIRQALTDLGVDLEAFESAYKATRKPRGTATITYEQRRAVHAYHARTVSFEELKGILGKKSDAGVAGVLRRVEAEDEDE